MTTIPELQQQIADEFALFGDWSERYQYLIDLGKSLPSFPAELKVEANLLKGCQSQVFVHFSPRQDELAIRAISDSNIVSGLIALVLRVFNGQSPSAILQSPENFLEQLGFQKNLSMTRKNGLLSLLARIRQEAKLRL